MYNRDTINLENLLSVSLGKPWPLVVVLTPFGAVVSVANDVAEVSKLVEVAVDVLESTLVELLEDDDESDEAEGEIDGLDWDVTVLDSIELFREEPLLVVDSVDVAFVVRNSKTSMLTKSSKCDQILPS